MDRHFPQRVCEIHGSQRITRSYNARKKDKIEEQGGDAESIERAHHFRVLKSCSTRTRTHTLSMSLAAAWRQRYDGNARASPPGHGYFCVH